MAWLPFDNPLVSILQGLVGTCGIFVMRYLLRVCDYVHYTRHTPPGGTSGKPHDETKSISRLSQGIQFFFLTVVLSVVGPRVSSLIVLEFCLRVYLASLLFGQENTHKITLQFLIQCQFSLGCALTCSLQFLYGGAPNCCLGLLLVAGVVWLLSSLARRLWAHVAQFFPQHCSQRDCGVCLILLSSGDALLPGLRRAVVITFAVGVGSAIAVMNQNFLLGVEDLRFWTPMTVCYILLLLRIMEEQQSSPGSEAVLQATAMRMGALLVPLVLVGRFVDVLQVLLFFLGECVCLLSPLGLLSSAAPL